MTVAATESNDTVTTNDDSQLDWIQYIGKRCTNTGKNYDELLLCWVYVSEWLTQCINEFDKHDTKYNISTETIITFRFDKFTSPAYIRSDDIYDLIRFMEYFNKTYTAYIDYYMVDPPVNRSLSCYNDTFFLVSEHQVKIVEYLHKITWRIYIFQKYILPFISLIIFTAGLLMTGTLLFIFIKHKKLRSGQNMILMNIAICDFIGITVLYPLQHIMYNLSDSIGFLIAYSCLALIISSASCLSILALSIQRLVLLVKTPVSSNGTKRWKIFIFVISVWFATPVWLLLTIFFLIVIGGAHFIGITVAFPITVFSCLLPVVITVLNSVTSYRLRKSAREMPEEPISQNQVQTRYRSAR